MSKSKYNPKRKTVGAIYRDAQMKNQDATLKIGDISHELTNSLVEDLNETIKSNPFDNKPFFITVHESKQLHMKKCIARRMIVTQYRPYPEDDTVVFHVDPEKNETRFCWCLPHWSEMDNVLNTVKLYPNEYVMQIRAWKAVDLHNFGFKKDPMGNWTPNEHHSDELLSGKPQTRIILSQ